MTPEQVREIREALTMTQKEFAEKIGVHWRTVQKWEGDERPIKGAAMKLIEQLAASLPPKPADPKPERRGRPRGK